MPMLDSRCFNERTGADACSCRTYVLLTRYKEEGLQSIYSPLSLLINLYILFLDKNLKKNGTFFITTIKKTQSKTEVGRSPHPAIQASAPLTSMCWKHSKKLYGRRSFANHSACNHNNYFLNETDYIRK